MSAQVYYHGGVIGRRPGDLICSALDLGRDYTEDYEAIRGVVAPLRYDPAFVYLTTHLGTARGYAARYKNLADVVRPGDVYIVEPQADLSPDPEYDNPSDPGHFVRTRQPVPGRRCCRTRRTAHAPRTEPRSMAAGLLFNLAAAVRQRRHTPDL